MLLFVSLGFCFSNVSITTGNRTYYLKHDLAKMEQALVRFTLDNLLRKVKYLQCISVFKLIYRFSLDIWVFRFYLGNIFIFKYYKCITAIAKMLSAFPQSPSNLISANNNILPCLLTLLVFYAVYSN